MEESSKKVTFLVYGTAPKKNLKKYQTPLLFQKNHFGFL
ncbi:hypothetical protein AI2601V1_5365 (plasmid) [Klebsiella pneumoniae]|uniref:Uncharacterized protein n=1 Tax=Klebsiella pneumoniae TaxID=573 RepID=A0A6M6A496_KLEPN|nr:hypothetical protein [Klebsiella pneumoniae]BBQ70428.1 hypothetical protein WP3W18C02_P11620 [Klebsiella quasipneumoniae]BBQ92258.1 hypothetical protein WP3W18E06_P11160 [Raoultella ornithinolytica]QJX12237.1 hypothetical protein [Klebsiella pneumoniae]CAE6200177.1 hypothetical protein AI2601V1_5365 [Klebsiella pneumoniae]